MVYRILRHGACAWVLVAIACGCPARAPAQCSDNEIIAVFIVDGVIVGEQPSVRNLYVMNHNTETFPSDEEMIASIGASALVGPISNIAEFDAFTVFYAPPSDFGYEAIIDHRSGGIMYKSPLSWFSVIDVEIPQGSNYEWNIDQGSLAPTPAAIGVATSAYWYTWYGVPETLAQGLVTYLRGSDVLKSFGLCGDYNTFCYFSHPAPGNAFYLPYAVVVVNGFCGGPWNGAPVAIEALSWGSVKIIYR